MIAALVEGNSIRATCRMTGVAKGTVLKLLVDLGRLARPIRTAPFETSPAKKIRRTKFGRFAMRKKRMSLKR